MSMIRADLDGVVIVHSGGLSYMLEAGDDIPEGALIDDSLVENDTAVADTEAVTDDVEKPTRRRGGSRARKS